MHISLLTPQNSLTSLDPSYELWWNNDRAISELQSFRVKSGKAIFEVEIKSIVI